MDSMRASSGFSRPAAWAGASAAGVSGLQGRTQDARGRGKPSAHRLDKKAVATLPSPRAVRVRCRARRRQNVCVRRLRGHTGWQGAWTGEARGEQGGREEAKGAGAALGSLGSGGRHDGWAERASELVERRRAQRPVYRRRVRAKRAALRPSAPLPLCARATRSALTRRAPALPRPCYPPGWSWTRPSVYNTALLAPTASAAPPEDAGVRTSLSSPSFQPGHYLALCSP